MEDRRGNELIFELEQVCPYLHDRTSLLPLRFQMVPISGPAFDRCLAAGDRRTGHYLYRTQCPTCRECEPIRVTVKAFERTRSQQRVWNRGERLMTMRMGAPIVDDRRVQLFNAHRNQRGLNQSKTEFGETDYQQFLLDTCCDTIALDFYLKDELVAVAICDRGAQAWSAVYTFFDPQFGHLSPGTYSILKQIDLCREFGVTWLYLGFYIEDCRHMQYKQVYRPNERLIEGQWTKFD